MTKIKRFIRFNVAFIFFILLFFQVANAFPLDISDAPITNALEYLKNSQQNNGGFSDSPPYYSDLTPFAIMAINAANQNIYEWKKNETTPIDFIKNVSIPSLNSSALPTHYSIVILALVSAGEDIMNISGRNLADELIARQNSDGSFSGNAWITDQEWAILALVAAGYNNTSILENACDYLISQQIIDGGFGGFGSSYPDETSLGIMALTASGYDPNSEAVRKATTRLKQFQISNGGFDSGWGEGGNVDSDAWALQAIAAIGNNFSEWKKSNFTIDTPLDLFVFNLPKNFSLNLSINNYGNQYPFDHLMGLQNSNGAFNYFKPVQDTSYAILALLGKPFPLSSTYYTQSTSKGIGLNQTFHLNINQTESWDFSISGGNNIEASAETLEIPIIFYPSVTSAGKKNNISILATSFSDSLNKSKNITADVQILCGNNLCESGESCSACSNDCGNCQVTQISSSSGGGGGNTMGGIWKIDSNELKKELKEGIQNKFILGNEEHSIIVKRINQTKISLEIYSKVIKEDLMVGETKKFDLNEDEIYDLAITLSSISSNKAYISIKSINESASIEAIEQNKCSVCEPLTEISDCIKGKATKKSYICSKDTNYNCISSYEEIICQEDKSGSKITGNIIRNSNSTTKLTLFTLIILALLVFLFLNKRKSNT